MFLQCFALTAPGDSLILILGVTFSPPAQTSSLSMDMMLQYFALAIDMMNGFVEVSG